MDSNKHLLEARIRVLEGDEKKLKRENYDIKKKAQDLFLQRFEKERKVSVA